MSTDPDLVDEYRAWRDSRADFNTRLKDGEQTALKERWQRHYMKGEKPTGDKAEVHQTKRRLMPPKEIK
jgi:hypothetical protein